MPHLNPLDESQVQAHREAIVSALRDLSEERVSFLLGVRRVLALANEAPVRDKQFDLFVAIDSETDHLPSESAKQHCSAAWLQKCHEEELQVQAFYKEEVLQLCAHLAARLSEERAQ